jgi:hypothetical protein
MNANEWAVEQARKELAAIEEAQRRALKIIAEQERLATGQAAHAAGKLVENVEIDRTGRRISTFTGPKSAWMDQFKSQGYRVKFMAKGWA